MQINQNFDGFVCPKCGHNEFSRDYSEMTYGKIYFTIDPTGSEGLTDEIESDSEGYEVADDFKCWKCQSVYQDFNELVKKVDWERKEKVRLLEEE